MWVQSLGWEGPLEEEVATHSSILTCKNPMDRGAWQATVHGVTKESDTTEQLSTHRHTSSNITAWLSVHVCTRSSIECKP